MSDLLIAELQTKSNYLTNGNGVLVIVFQRA